MVPVKLLLKLKMSLYAYNGLEILNYQKYYNKPIYEPLSSQSDTITNAEFRVVSYFKWTNVIYSLSVELCNECKNNIPIQDVIPVWHV